LAGKCWRAKGTVSEGLNGKKKPERTKNEQKRRVGLILCAKKRKKKAHNIELEIQISDIMYMLILDATDLFHNSHALRRKVRVRPLRFLVSVRLSPFISNSLLLQENECSIYHIHSCS
jgi:hypothetical protein